MKRYCVSGMLMAVMFLFLSAGTAKAASIFFQSTDLPDTIAGEDLWRYSYTVADFTYVSGYGFSIYFDSDLYTSLQAPAPSVNADWDVIVFQPDSNIPADGIYDALALTDSASLSDPFSLTFVWLGNGTPGAQDFDVYDSDWEIVETGFTEPATTVPLPAAILLLGSGILGLVLKRKF